jgi:hypothetical protein
MPHLELDYPRPDIAVLTLNRPEKRGLAGADRQPDSASTACASR